MADSVQLPELLYGAHAGLEAIVLEIRDWRSQVGSDVLVVQRDADGRTRLRPTGGGLYAKPYVGTRWLWCELPDRVRVEVLEGDRVVRTAVRDGGAWWRWDPEEGESAGDLARGAALPPMLDLMVLEPARFLALMWLEVTGTGSRAGREVITARGTPRQQTVSASPRFDFEFDAVHGTPLRMSTFEADARTNVTEVLSVDYAPSLDRGIFNFEQRSPNTGVSSGGEDTGGRRRPRRVPPGPGNGASSVVSTRPVLADYATIWLTGIPGAGKTTVARATERLLHQLGVPCCVLDGDELREGLSSDLGLSRQDRGEQARRAAQMATILANSGVVPIVALISPYAEDRQRAREIHEAAAVGFVEVWVDTPREVCAARDPKGLYAAARALSTVRAPAAADGSGLTGLTAPYETPTSPDLRVSGDGQAPRTAAIAIVERLLANWTKTFGTEAVLQGREARWLHTET